MVLVLSHTRKTPFHHDFAQEVMHGACARHQRIRPQRLEFRRELPRPLLRLPVASRHIIGVQPQPRT